MISVVIPHWPLSEQHDALLERCVRSLEGHDELIIVVNDGIGFAKAVNRGLRLARGDFLFVVNNDTVAQGNLQAMCVEGAVVVPKITGQVDNNPRAFYSMHRSVLEQVGYLDENFTVGYWEDDDYIRRMNLCAVPIQHTDKVSVVHVGGATMEHTAKQLAYDINRAYYEKKWGE